MFSSEAKIARNRQLYCKNSGVCMCRSKCVVLRAQIIRLFYGFKNRGESAGQPQGKRPCLQLQRMINPRLRSVILASNLDLKTP